MDSKFAYEPMWYDIFNREEVNRVIQICEEFELTRGTTIGDKDIDNSRMSNIRWIEVNEKTKWMYERVRDAVQDINSNHYMFDIKGMENFQFTEYSQDYTGFYDYHQDTMVYPDLSGVRKISVTILLSDHSEFEGGEFIYQKSQHAFIPKLVPGRALIFPSWLLHKVNPVFIGKRKSLVCWVYGDLFK